MAFTNINDPAGVKSLLDQLRSSQAWQDTIDQVPSQGKEPSADLTPHAASEPSPPTVSLSTNREAVPTGTSVASLLSQLQSSPTWSAAVFSPTRPPPVCAPTTSTFVSAASASASDTSFGRSPTKGTPIAARKDVRSYTFQQALPLLAQLSGDPDFVALLSKVKQEQADLERQLFQERLAIQAKHEEKVKLAQAKAKIVGVGLSKHEADMISHAYQKEMKRFDTERALVAWDGLVVKQQTALENMGVPAMFVTDILTDRERQQRIVQVLEGIAGGES